MSVPYFLVNAFTCGNAGGNPAGVCLLHEPLEDDQMQRIAATLGLSETAFALREANSFSLRWFTPKVEVALCGHATLATAHVLWEAGKLSEGTPATFETLSGKLSATKVGTWIRLDFPSLAVRQVKPPTGLLDALGVTPIYVGKSRFDLLVRVSTEAEVREASPRFADLLRIKDIRGVMLTAESNSAEYDFVSRFFAPAAGIDEDPVTGSAHCCLGPYWANIIGRDNLVGCQCSKRGGIVQVHVTKSRVELSGQAVTTGQGVLATV
jgi:predicted PhzF superfamily epimerase YddE/YHI9